MSLADKILAKIATQTPPTEKIRADLSAKLIEKHDLTIRTNSKAGKALLTGGVSRTSEFERIFKLPRRQLDLTKVEDYTDRFRTRAKCDEPTCSLCRHGEARLWPIQNAALAEAESQGGLFGALGVGSGKTGLSLLVSAVINARRAVLLVPPEVQDQLIRVDIPAWRRHYAFPAVNVLSYSMLSTVKGMDSLDEMKPDLIVADECHRLKRKQSTRTTRFRSYMSEHAECRLVALSGTIATRSLLDYAHLLELCLRKNSPLPKHYRELMEWADAIDVIREGEERIRRAPGVLLQFCEEGEEVRSGYRRRFVETKGVVATTESAIGTTLYLDETGGPEEVPEVINQALETLEATWQIGNEELSDAMALARVAKQISCGFYYVWDWPDGVIDHEWMEARNAWNREVRKFLRYRSQKGLDSPLLVTNAVLRGEIPDLFEVWSAWDAVRDRPEPPTKPIWIDPFLVNYCADWLDSRDEGIVWFEHRAFESALRDKGVKVFGAGQDEELLTTAERKIACSIRAHGTGKNLQRWASNFIASCPANGPRMEQCIGRTHRPGQEADAVFVELSLHTGAMHAAWQSALADARFHDQAHGQPQKILYANRVKGGYWPTIE